MPVRFGNYTKILITLCLILSVGLLEGEAQTRKKKRTRRTSKPAVAKPVITNPTVAPPETTTGAAAANTGDVKIISTADPNAATTTESSDLPGWKPKVTTPAQTPPAQDQQDM